MILINYLKSLYQYSKQLFFVITLGITITLVTFILQITNILYIEATPFVVWGMYSEKQQPKENYQIPLITVNNHHYIDYLNEATSLEKLMITNPLLYYKKINDNNDEDARRFFVQSHLKGYYKKWGKQLDACTNSQTNYPAFFNWYKKYLGQTGNLKVDSVKFQLLNVAFSGDKKIIIRDTINVINF